MRIDDLPTVPTDPTGEQFTITSEDGGTTATIAEVGASLRHLVSGGTDLVPPYPAGSPTPAGSGIVLVPWPNRVRDGRWNDDGERRQLAITEPAYGNASHGLLRFAPYRLAAASTDAVTLTATIFAQTGYPYVLGTAVTYAVTDGALSATHVIRNLGAGSAPVALGTHPYFCIGDAPTEELVLTSSGATMFTADAQKIPTGVAPVDAATDLRAGRRLGELDLDTAYTDLVRGDDGRVHTTLAAPDGRAIDVWQGEGFDYVQVFTTDRYPGRPLTVAIEPMTAPADAFNSGRSLRRLATGESWTLEWGVTFSA